MTVNLAPKVQLAIKLESATSKTTIVHQDITATKAHTKSRPANQELSDHRKELHEWALSAMQTDIAKKLPALYAPPAFTALTKLNQYLDCANQELTVPLAVASPRFATLVSIVLQARESRLLAHPASTAREVNRECGSVSSALIALLRREQRLLVLVVLTGQAIQTISTNPLLVIHVAEAFTLCRTVMLHLSRDAKIAPQDTSAPAEPVRKSHEMYLLMAVTSVLWDITAR